MDRNFLKEEQFEGLFKTKVNYYLLIYISKFDAEGELKKKKFSIWCECGLLLNEIINIKFVFVLGF